MPKKEPTGKKPTVKLSDLVPKENPQGGGLSYGRKPALAIPPPGFFSSHSAAPHNGAPVQNR